MTAMEWAFAGIIIALLMICYTLAVRWSDAEDGLLDVSAEQQEDHAKCLALVSAFVGDTFAAQVLQAAAADYDSAEGQANISRIRHDLWVENGPSIPSLWMRDRAEEILARAQERIENSDE